MSEKNQNIVCDVVISGGGATGIGLAARLEVQDWIVAKNAFPSLHWNAMLKGGEWLARPFECK